MIPMVKVCAATLIGGQLDLINYVNYFTPFFDDFNLIMYVVLVK